MLIVLFTLKPDVDEEQMGDIISLVDSVQDDYLPPIPLRYKTPVDEPEEPKFGKIFPHSH